MSLIPVITSLNGACQAGPSIGGISVQLSGTITASVIPSDIVTGGKTIILDVTGDTWIT